MPLVPCSFGVEAFDETQHATTLEALCKPPCHEWRLAVGGLLALVVHRPSCDRQLGGGVPRRLMVTPHPTSPYMRRTEFSVFLCDALMHDV